MSIAEQFQPTQEQLLLPKKSSARARNAEEVLGHVNADRGPESMMHLRALMEKPFSTKTGVGWDPINDLDGIQFVHFPDRSVWVIDAPLTDTHQDELYGGKVETPLEKTIQIINHDVGNIRHEWTISHITALQESLGRIAGNAPRPDSPYYERWAHICTTTAKGLLTSSNGVPATAENEKRLIQESGRPSVRIGYKLYPEHILDQAADVIDYVDIIQNKETYKIVQESFEAVRREPKLASDPRQRAEMLRSLSRELHSLFVDAELTPDRIAQIEKSVQEASEGIAPDFVTDVLQATMLAHYLKQLPDGVDFQEYHFKHRPEVKRKLKIKSCAEVLPIGDNIFRVASKGVIFYDNAYGKVEGINYYKSKSDEWDGWGVRMREESDSFTVPAMRYSNKFYRTQFKDISREMLFYLATHGIDGGPFIPYVGPNGEVLRERLQLVKYHPYDDHTPKRVLPDRKVPGIIRESAPEIIVPSTNVLDYEALYLDLLDRQDKK